MLVLCLLSLVLSPAECSDPEVEVVIPQLLWAGEVPLPLQGDESVFSNIRRPRSVTRGVGSHPDDMYIHLPALGQNLHLHLQRNLKFLASGFTVEERTELGENVQTRIPVDDLCFYTGEVLNHNGSFASLSACSGLMGYIQIGEDQVMIEPANTSTDPSSSFSGKKHIIRRKRQVEEPGSNPDVQHSNCQLISGKKKKTSKREGGSDWRERRNAIRLTEEHTLETLVVADSDMVQYHGADATQRFILTVMNMVYNMFQHQSLGIKVNIRVTKLVLLHSRPTKLSIGHHGERSLESFCHWQNEEYGGTKYLGNNHVPGAKEETPVDVAVFMTRTDFCVHKDEPCDTVGIAYLGGACSAKRKCVLAEDNGLNLAFTIAHELGHKSSPDEAV